MSQDPPPFNPAAALEDASAIEPADVQLPSAKRQANNVVPLPRNHAARVDDGKPIKALKVALKLTLNRWKGGFLSQSIDDPRIHSARLSREQAVALKLLACSLHRQNEKMSNGRHVASNPDAIRWLLDRIVEEIPPKLMQRLLAEAAA